METKTIVIGPAVDQVPSSGYSILLMKNGVVKSTHQIIERKP